MLGSPATAVQRNKRPGAVPARPEIGARHIGPGMTSAAAMY